MYNYTLQITYKQPNQTDDIYRKELIQFFNMDTYNESVIYGQIPLLYQSVQQYYTSVITKLKSTVKVAMLCNLDNVSCFTLLFSWTYFYDHYYLLVAIHNRLSSSTDDDLDTLDQHIKCKTLLLLQHIIE
jgi:hypothetical protein